MYGLFISYERFTLNFYMLHLRVVVRKRNTLTLPYMLFMRTVLRIHNNMLRMHTIVRICNTSVTIHTLLSVNMF